jgi:hypothetical protein
MILGRYLTAIGLTLLFAMPVVAQTTKSPSPRRPPHRARQNRPPANPRRRGG